MTRLAVCAVAFLLVVAAVPASAATGGGAAADVGGVPPADTGGQCSFPVTKTDATGTSVTVSAEPKRVAVLQPSAAQTMWEIGAADTVVGISNYNSAQYLDGAGSKQNLGTYSTDVEKVVGANPDLVLAANIVDDETVSKLRDSGLTVYKFRFADSLDFVAEKTRRYGELVGKCDAADERADELASEIDLIRSALSEVDNPKTAYFMTQTGWTAGKGTFIHEALEASGVDNMADEVDASKDYYKYNQEVVIAEDPTWIIQPRDFDLSAYGSTTAVEEGNVVTVDENYISQPAPRVIQAMLTIVKTVHPGAYERAKLEEKLGSESDAYEKRTDVDANGLAVLSVEHAQSATTAFEVPDGFESPTRPVRIERVTVTAAASGATYIATVEHEDANPDSGVNGTFVGSYYVQAGGLTAADFEGATLEFTVARSVLEARGVTSDAVRVYYRGETFWDDQPVEVVNESGDRLRFRVSLTEEGVFGVAIPGVPTATATATPTETPPPTTSATAATTEATAEATGTDTPASTETATETTATAAPSTTAGSGPGFGVLGALLALGSLLLVRRRP